VKHSALASALLLATLTCARAQQVPPGYPVDYREIIAAAEQEGSVGVYSTTDSASADALLKDFRALYPKVQVRHYDLNSTEVYNRYLSETAANAETADVLWSGSMDLQLKLVPTATLWSIGRRKRPRCRNGRSTRIAPGVRLSNRW
jgi:iron(III) transport system substrate-binding protein